MAKISRENATLTALLGASSNLHPRESNWKTGVFNATNAELILPADGCSTVSAYVSGTFSLNIEISGTIDGVNWIPILIKQINPAGSVSSYTSVQFAGGYIGKCSQYIATRIRCISYTSGSANIFFVTENGIPDEMHFGQNVSSVVTTIGTVGAATTLTLPSPGGNLRQRLQSLFIGRYVTTTLTASATPGAISSTNFPGSIAWTFAQDAATIGQFITAIKEDKMGLSCNNQNSASTIVMPATTGVIWRATATYDIIQ